MSKSSSENPRRACWESKKSNLRKSSNNPPPAEFHLFSGTAITTAWHKSYLSLSLSASLHPSILPPSLLPVCFFNIVIAWFHPSAHAFVVTYRPNISLLCASISTWLYFAVIWWTCLVVLMYEFPLFSSQFEQLCGYFVRFQGLFSQISVRLALFYHKRKPRVVIKSWNHR